MKKISYSLMVGLSFIAFQVSIANAQESGSGMSDGNSIDNHNSMGGNHNSMGGQDSMGGNHNSMGGQGSMDMSPQAIQERCKGAPTDAERANCVASNNRMTKGAHHDGPKGAHHDGPKGEHHDGPKGAHHDGPKGEHHDGPPIDPRSGQPFTQADEVKFQKFADECEATRGLLSEGSTQELVKEGFTRIQVEKLCKDGPEQGSGGGQGGHNAPPASR